MSWRVLIDVAAEIWLTCATITIMGSLVWMQVSHFIWQLRGAAKYGVWNAGFVFNGKPVGSGWTQVHGGEDYVGTYKGARGYAHYCNLTCGGTYTVKRYRKV